MRTNIWDNLLFSKYLGTILGTEQLDLICTRCESAVSGGLLGGSKSHLARMWSSRTAFHGKDDEDAYGDFPGTWIRGCTLYSLFGQLLLVDNKKTRWTTSRASPTMATLYHVDTDECFMLEDSCIKRLSESSALLHGLSAVNFTEWCRFTFTTNESRNGSPFPNFWVFGTSCISAAPRLGWAVIFEALFVWSSRSFALNDLGILRRLARYVHFMEILMPSRDFVEEW